MTLSYSVVKDIYSNLHTFESMKELVKRFLKDKPAIRDYMEDLKHDIKVVDGDMPMTSYKKGLVEFATSLQIKFAIIPVDPADKLPWDYEIRSVETDYNGGKSPTLVGTINLETNKIRPAHGYCSPNPTGKRMQKFADLINFEFATY